MKQPFPFFGIIQFKHHYTWLIGVPVKYEMNRNDMKCTSSAAPLLLEKAAVEDASELAISKSPQQKSEVMHRCAGQDAIFLVDPQRNSQKKKIYIYTISANVFFTKSHLQCVSTRYRRDLVAADSKPDPIQWRFCGSVDQPEVH